MAKVNLTTIKNWFKTGLKPTQAQFWNTWDSFFHKDDKIPIEQVEGIEEIYETITNHLQDPSAHALIIEKARVIPYGKLLILKIDGNKGEDEVLEPGDFVIGFVEGTLLNAGEYMIGDPSLLSSYDGYDQPTNKVGKQ